VEPFAPTELEIGVHQARLARLERRLAQSEEHNDA
jgi:hypothetical protein